MKNQTLITVFFILLLLGKNSGLRGESSFPESDSRQWTSVECTGTVIGFGSVEAFVKQEDGEFACRCLLTTFVRISNPKEFSGMEFDLWPTDKNDEMKKSEYGKIGDEISFMTYVEVLEHHAEMERIKKEYSDRAHNQIDPGERESNK